MKKVILILVLVFTATFGFTQERIKPAEQVRPTTLKEFKAKEVEIQTRKIDRSDMLIIRLENRVANTTDPNEVIRLNKIIANHKAYNKQLKEANVQIAAQTKYDREQERLSKELKREQEKLERENIIRGNTRIIQ